ncbi:Peroxisomal membrane protein PMP27 [Mortierella alpina]|uniref:Peroxisomal membrane protein PMP27 n=1 Tax=Mortierella alpina TaxID=64518 RepID=A0A9P6J860_MORAP|nr:Peroxisomal membrane protein PMP27 [Mortierella alpina]
MHPWSTERAKVAAETEISPPISPKQRALSGVALGTNDSIEPLHHGNTSIAYDTPLSTHSHSHSPYTHYHGLHLHQHDHNHDHDHDHEHHHSGTSGELFLSRTSTCSSSSDSASDSSSASSSSTSLSSVSSVSASLVPKSSAARNPFLQHSLAAAASSPAASLQKLQTEKSLELFLLDTPPSSHVPSPSSPSCPTLSAPQPTEQTSRPKGTLRPWTGRAPFHCTKKSIPQIVREISDVVDGRDKTIKVVQYFCKVFLWAFLSNPKQSAVLAARMKALAKQFSTTRKVLRLGHFIDPMASVLTLAVTLRANLRKDGLRRTLDKAPSQDWRNTLRDRLGHLNSVLGFVQDISDDIYCLGVIGVLDRSFTDKAEPWSNRLWMVGVSIDLHENLQTIRDVRRQIKAVEQKLTLGGSHEDEEAWRAQYTKLSTKLHWLQVTTVKLGGDFLFCGYDNLNCSFSDGFQAVSGFISGLAGAYKYVGKIMES